MLNYNFNTSKGRYYSEYARFNKFVPPASSDTKSLRNSTEIIQNCSTCIKSVLFALSIATTVIVGSAWQLYNSLEIAPIYQKITRVKHLPKTNSIKNKDRLITIDRNTKKNLEILTFKNAIAKGRF